MRTLSLAVTLVTAIVLSGCEALCAPSCGALREHPILRVGGVDTRHESRESSAAAFGAAADQMIDHLDRALADLQAQVRAGHANLQVVHKDGGKGGAGAFSWGWLVALVPLLVWRVRRRAGAAQADVEAAAAVDATAPPACFAARHPVVRSEMRRPRTARSARAIRMRVPRLSVRN